MRLCPAKLHPPRQQSMHKWAPRVHSGPMQPLLLFEVKERR